jgi:hypothetical protein
VPLGVFVYFERLCEDRGRIGSLSASTSISLPATGTVAL